MGIFGAVYGLFVSLTTVGLRHQASGPMRSAAQSGDHIYNPVNLGSFIKSTYEILTLAFPLLNFFFGAKSTISFET